VDETATLGYLEALAHTLGVEIRYESMEGDNPFSSGGMCQIYLKPVLRDLLEDEVDK